jgi:hypothetical protein
MHVSITYMSTKTEKVKRKREVVPVHTMKTHVGVEI